MNCLLSISDIQETDTSYVVIALVVIAILWIGFRVFGNKGK